MSDLESRIVQSYDRLHVGNAVYLLRNHEIDYGQLPDPDQVDQVYKADIHQVDPECIHGAYLLDWPDLQTKADPDQGIPIYQVSPREVFLLRELNVVLRDRTHLPKPKSSKLDRYLGSESGKFSATMASAMARVVLERFAEDPRDDAGNLLIKR